MCWIITAMKTKSIFNPIINIMMAEILLINNFLNKFVIKFIRIIFTKGGQAKLSIDCLSVQLGLKLIYSLLKILVIALNIGSYHLVGGRIGGVGLG